MEVRISIMVVKSTIWMRFRGFFPQAARCAESFDEDRSCGAGSVECLVERRACRQERHECLCAAAAAGVWGDFGVMTVALEAMEGDLLSQTGEDR